MLRNERHEILHVRATTVAVPYPLRLAVNLMDVNPVCAVRVSWPTSPQVPRRRTGESPGG